MTAMMAFFLVMWIVGLNDNAKAAVAAYFRDPIGFMKAVQAGEDPFSIGKGVGKAVIKPEKPPSRGKLDEKTLFNKTKDILEQELHNDPVLRNLEKYVKIEVANEGLRIDFVDASVSMFFDSGSAEIKPEFRRLLKIVAEKLRLLPNHLVIEGHTDNAPYVGKANYSNWELSADRANAARRLLEKYGIRQGQIIQVIGYADSMPKNRKNPRDYVNRRVSILVKFREDKPKEVNISQFTQEIESMSSHREQNQSAKAKQPFTVFERKKIAEKPRETH